MGRSNNIKTMKRKIKIKRLFIAIIAQLSLRVRLFERVKDENGNNSE